MIGRVKKIGGDLLLHAINHANVHEVVALIEEQEADVNYANINGQTPLHVSKMTSIIIVVRCLSSEYDVDRDAVAVWCEP